MKDFLLIALPTLILSIAVSLGITILFRVIKEKNKQRLAKKFYEEAMKKAEEYEKEKEKIKIKNRRVYSWEKLKKLLEENKERERKGLAFLETITAYHLPANEYKKVFEYDPDANELFEKYGTSNIRIDIYYDSKNYVLFEIREEDQENEKTKGNWT